MKIVLGLKPLNCFCIRIQKVEKYVRTLLELKNVFTKRRLIVKVLRLRLNTLKHKYIFNYLYIKLIFYLKCYKFIVFLNLISFIKIKNKFICLIYTLYMIYSQILQIYLFLINLISFITFQTFIHMFNSIIKHDLFLNIANLIHH